MTVYVAEIKGRGIAAFHADNGAEAERLVRDRVFRDDLMVLASNGLPLWDGVAGIQVRQALPWEEAKWRASRAKAIRQCNIEREDDSWIAFLVALTRIPLGVQLHDFLLSMDGDASTAGTLKLKLHRHRQKADPLFRSR